MIKKSPEDIKSEHALTVRVFHYEFDLEASRCYQLEAGPEKRRDLLLTPIEFWVFFTLVRAQGNIVTRREIEQAVWQPRGSLIEVRGIDTHIAHLRRKLGDYKSWIVSVYGNGYAFREKKAA